VDVGLVVQENALVELDDVVVVALVDVVLTEVRLALDVIVDDEADVVKFALDVIETEDVLLTLELAVEEVDVMVADTLTDVLTEDFEVADTLVDELTEEVADTLVDELTEEVADTLMDELTEDFEEVADTPVDELTEDFAEVTDTLIDELTEVRVRDTEELEETLTEPLAVLETLVFVLETVLEAVVQFAMSLAPCTLDAEIAFPTELFK
jgi:ribosomal protein S17E